MFWEIDDLMLLAVQCLGIGIAIGMVVGDFLDKRDELSWKSRIREIVKREQELETLSRNLQGGHDVAEQQ